MIKTKISAKIVADSVNEFGDRLTTFELTYPRIIHAELLTHRMFSKNASSSRAVPVKKMIESVRNNTFVPFQFQKTHKGMQGSEYFVENEKEECRQLWLKSAELALQQAEKMDKKGISKQIINRILEPYQYYTIILTTGKEGLSNFFNLRCPSYEIDSDAFGTKIFKSRKSAREYCKMNGIEPPYSELDWLNANTGQAEIHMMELAECMYDAYNESIPKQLKAGDYHIPYWDKLSITEATLITSETKDGNDVNFANKIYHTMIKASTGLCARVSYTTVGDEAKPSVETLVKIHDKMVNAIPAHSSPMEHCSRAMSSYEYACFAHGYPDPEGGQNEDNGWCKNFKGFIQYRYLLENNLPL